MAKPTGSRRSGRASAEERQLELAKEELVRKQRELETRLRRLPAVIEKQEEQRRLRSKQRAAAARPAISPDGTATGSRNRSRNLRTPARQRAREKLMTLGWLLLLGIIIYMLVRAIPTA